MKTLRSYEASIEFYQQVKQTRVPAYVRDQLLRAALSISLNLSEGNDRLGAKDRRRFFNMALTSLRECQTLIRIENLDHLVYLADRLGAQIYLLQRNCLT